MRLVASLLVLLAIRCLSGCSDAQSQLDLQTLDELPANSCAIACPADTAYPGLRASVGSCNDGYAPVCQCVDESRPMATCETLP
jgi:hypothetical protein